MGRPQAVSIASASAPALAAPRTADDPDAIGLQLPGQPDLNRHHLGDLRNLVGGDLSIRRPCRPELRERALSKQLAQPPTVPLGDEEPRGVRSNVDAGAAGHVDARPILS